MDDKYQAIMLLRVNNLAVKHHSCYFNELPHKLKEVIWNIARRQINAEFKESVKKG